MWNGLGVGLANVWRLADAETRSISPENFTGEKGAGGMATEGTGAGAARDLGRGWKISPSVSIEPGETFVMADIEGSGAIQHIWLTPTGGWRNQILRFYWDDDPRPAVECPVGDFFACGWGEYAQVSSLAVCVNPGRSFNCYWEMPFQRRARITITNECAETRILYYQVTYSLGAVPGDAGRFCAQFRRVNPLPKGDVVTILDGVRGRGQYVGTYCAWGVNNAGWWGEGELKFFIDGDGEVPDHLRNWNGGLLLRVVQLRRRRSIPRVHDALCRHAPGVTARRGVPVPAALRPVPLAPHRSHSLPLGPEGDDASPRMAARRALPATPGRYRHGRLLVPNLAPRTLP